MPMDYVKELVKQELRKLPLPVLFTGIFYAFLGVLTGSVLLGLNDSESSGYVVRLIQKVSADLITVSMVSCLGFVFTKEYFSYYKTDAFSRKLAFYRKLPLTDREIVQARFLVFAVTLLPMALCFFTPIFLMANVDHLATGPEFIKASLMWLGLSLAGGAGFIYFEMSVSGKAYLGLSMVAVGVFLIAVVGLNASGINLVGGSLSLVRSYGIWPSIAGLAAGALLACRMAAMTVRRLAVRDLV